MASWLVTQRRSVGIWEPRPGASLQNLIALLRMGIERLGGARARPRRMDRRPPGGCFDSLIESKCVHTD
jgi:hypothetical protein